MIKYALRFILIVFLLAGLVELILRFQFGFCNSPLYITDPDFEYIYAPNQEVKRFGHVVRTNSLSMRNEELSEKDTLNILLIGDSVVNGGSLTDQDSIASTLLQKRFRAQGYPGLNILNISAGSWGPDNVAAYLKKYGTFKAQLICLVTSSHDAHDIMTHISPIGIDPGMPDKQYPLALIELWDRYRHIIWYTIEHGLFLPVTQWFDQPEKNNTPDQQPAPETKEILENEGIRKDGEGFNPGYAQLDSIAKANNIPFFIYLHPEISELALGHFNSQGQSIIDFAEQNQVRLINELELGIDSTYYRPLDVVHYNVKGQKFLTDRLYPLMEAYLTPIH
ncbi:hypothetical protein CLV98_11035 [Dyadobacter jejuensis]|uniref:GDSL-like lipase/acylhydrolase family protein n=1 Tax=Dyadobacter jejuensis TaxID=1082580 RepID=A0A316AID3_9BACT|nr:hypothetical protein [Dyadobacter jejuensis]PWJ56724.1 hypothetical protein CLV98_11035 [Dyadobacter jejuensis]